MVRLEISSSPIVSLYDYGEKNNIRDQVKSTAEVMCAILLKSKKQNESSFFSINHQRVNHNKSHLLLSPA